MDALERQVRSFHRRWVARLCIRVGVRAGTAGLLALALATLADRLLRMTGVLGDAHATEGWLFGIAAGALVASLCFDAWRAAREGVGRAAAIRRLDTVLELQEGVAAALEDEHLRPTPRRSALRRRQRAQAEARLDPRRLPLALPWMLPRQSVAVGVVAAALLLVMPQPVSMERAADAGTDSAGGVPVPGLEHAGEETLRSRADALEAYAGQRGGDPYLRALARELHGAADAVADDAAERIDADRIQPLMEHMERLAGLDRAEGDGVWEALDRAVSGLDGTWSDAASGPEDGPAAQETRALSEAESLGRERDRDPMEMPDGYEPEARTTELLERGEGEERGSQEDGGVVSDEPLARDADVELQPGEGEAPDDARETDQAGVGESGPGPAGGDGDERGGSSMAGGEEGPRPPVLRDEAQRLEAGLDTRMMLLPQLSADRGTERVLAPPEAEAERFALPDATPRGQWSRQPERGMPGERLEPAAGEAVTRYFRARTQQAAGATPEEAE